MFRSMVARLIPGSVIPSFFLIRLRCVSTVRKDMFRSEPISLQAHASLDHVGYFNFFLGEPVHFVRKPLLLTRRSLLQILLDDLEDFLSLSWLLDLSLSRRGRTERSIWAATVREPSFLLSHLDENFVHAMFFSRSLYCHPAVPFSFSADP